MRSSERKWGDNPGTIFITEEYSNEKIARARVCFFAIGTVFGGVVGPAAYAFARWALGY